MKHAIMQSTVVRSVRGMWWLMNGRERGFSRTAYPHDSLDDIEACWDVVIGAEGSDEYGPFVNVHPAGSAAALAAQLDQARAQLLGVLASRLAPDTSFR